MTDEQLTFPEDTPTNHEPRTTNHDQYRARLAAKLKDPEFRKIDGFPIGTDEAILALSDPPYYTACPNPFVEEWLQQNASPYDPATDTYHREPFATDVSEGKNDPIYNAHSYHTKVPHKAIMRYILHYTEPGDVVYDGFCGTGMTGVAAQMCGKKAEVESLSCTVDEAGNIWEQGAWQQRSKQEARNKGTQEQAQVQPPVTSHEPRPFSRLGARKAILNDLSPAATFIAYNYNTPVDAVAFEREAKRVLQEVEEECGWMYSTLHDASPAETARIVAAVELCQSAVELRVLYKDLQSARSSLRDPNSKLQVGRINYTVWSDVFICPNCGAEIVFWDAAFDASTGKVADEFSCAECRAEATKRQCQRAMVTHYDAAIKQAVTQTKQVAVLVNFTVGRQRHERRPTAADSATVAAIESLPLTSEFPSSELPHMHMTHERAKLSARGVTHLHHFHTARALHSLSFLWRAAKCANNSRMQRFLLFMAEQTVWSMSKQNRYRADAFSQANQYMSGVYYISSLSSETSPWYILDGKARRLAKVFAGYRPDTGVSVVTTGSCAVPLAAPDSIDYIFTDPPFGENIYYADLNYLVESWHGVLTDSRPEAIIDQAKKKRLVEYQELMTASFRAYYRILKPGRWMTVEFSNSSNAVWNAIQEGLERVGFIVADIRVLDKKSGSYRQVTASSTVKEDLVISCYKPHRAFAARFQQLQGKPEGVVEFLREHLIMLPVAPVTKSGRLERVAERNRFLLFDRMLAYHLQRGARIPLSSATFYQLLAEQFIERDEMYFLPDQAARYDAMKARGVEIEQLSIFIRDEMTAVQWVRARLTEQPQMLGDLTPKFMQELREWESHEPRPELRDLLREYFVEEGSVWRVPDPNNERDLEALRHNALLKLFRDYVNTNGPLKVFRKEAILEGFRHCWETKQYGIILALCEKMPAKILQEIHEFVQFYDIAKDLAPTMELQTSFVWE
jgi:DNA modification methylase